MASSSSRCIWKKDFELAKVEFEDDIAAEITIINEGYMKAPVIKRGIGIINLRCSGKLCVNRNDPLCRGEFVVNPQDASDKLILYKLDVGERRDMLQPQVILLESQLKKNHFLHWTMPGPSVTFQEFERYDSDGPQIDINNDSDQRFVWIIPINRTGNDQFSLRPYDQSYYLTCMSTTDANTDKALVVKGGGNDETDFYKLEQNP